MTEGPLAASILRPCAARTSERRELDLRCGLYADDAVLCRVDRNNPSSSRRSLVLRGKEQIAWYWRDD